jgi:hypothetical protein
MGKDERTNGYMDEGGILLMETQGLNHPDKRLENQYKKTFFKNRHRLNWRAPIVCRAIKEIINPMTVVDVGCATGDLIAAYEGFGICSRGIDGSENCIEYLECERHKVIIHDLRTPLITLLENPKFDLATCFEVAEHIEPEYVDVFLDNLCKLSDKILISAAPPGQQGRNHFNCQPVDYWVLKFAKRDYFYNGYIVKDLRKAFTPWKERSGIRAYYNNLLFFEK